MRTHTKTGTCVRLHPPAHPRTHIHPYNSYWVPLPEDRTYPGFIEMYESDYAMFADDSKWSKYAKEYGYLDDS